MTAERLEHEAAIDLLAVVVRNVMGEYKPDDLSQVQRSLMYGVAAAIGMLIDPPEEGDLMVFDIYIRDGMVHAMSRAIA